MKKRVHAFLLFISISLVQVSCNHSPNTLFQLVSSDQTGVTFSNTIQETEDFNILTYEYIYNGGGVAIADFDNNGLPDIFLSGNEVPNRLYINRGDFRFEDITEIAGVNVPGRWNSGIAVADVNNDGWMDLYVCATMKPDAANRRNMLFINNGKNQNGIPTFSEMAAAYKVDDDGFSVSAAFFDYDQDGDLDLYVLTNEKLNNVPTNYRPKITDGSSLNNDRLYRNNGDGTFTNVAKEVGISIEGFGLGLSIADFNKDGWPDIYVSNDYLSNDILYINNKDGTFKNGIAEFIGHQSQFSMGNDVADFNNDALPDIVTLDMLPEINGRKKSTISNKSYQNYINNEKFHYEYQYVRNMLQLNNGLDQGIKFSEIGQLSGIYQTEWSWSPLFADFDNDGNKDLLITNGFPKDITDKDFANFRADVGNVAGIRYLIDSIPVVKIPNYAYRNNGDLTFSNVTKEWGLTIPSFSNGAAFADLDNDGDLDYVVNNINDVAFVFKNTLYEPSQKKDERKNNFLRIKLNGSGNNRQGIGAKVTLLYDRGKLQYHEQSIYRGFLSSVEGIVHFGVGNILMIDSVFIEWSDGNVQLLQNVGVNQVVTVSDEPGAGYEALQQFKSKKKEALFEKAKNKTAIRYKHIEDDKIDFNIQRTLPHKFSQSGPGICVGDINGDDLEDLIIGGSADYQPSVYIQMPGGTFSLDEKGLKEENKVEEDEGLLLFDADNDGDLDLYCVSGSIETGKSFDIYQDRLYINNGKGGFTLDKNAIPETKASGSCVRAADYDADGDLDLFVGGRVVPGGYPYPAVSYLLRNDRGVFSDVTSEVCPKIKTLGMITDALWSDFNQDGTADLVVVGEFMSVTFFKNDGGKFNQLSNTGVDQQTGWWNSITSGDYDKDGDIDYVIGNLGWNNNYEVTQEHPLKIYAKDFDANGSIDPVLACYMKESIGTGIKKLYPVHFWDELSSQSPKFRRKYSSYKQYGKATVTDLLTNDDLKDALVLEANNMATSYVENLGNGAFRMKPLPTLTQVAPVNGMVTDDANNDGNLDILMVGNDYGNEVFAGRYDAFTGLVLIGDGKGSFAVMSASKSGFYIGGDGKALVKLIGAEGVELFIASQNRDSLKIFEKKTLVRPEILAAQPMDSRAEIIYPDGKKELVEFYYGSGYLSQSTRSMVIPKGTAEIIMYDYKGQSRKVVPKELRKQSAIIKTN